MSAVKRVEFASGKMVAGVIIVLNVHAPTEAKTDDVKGSFYEELERVFDKFPKYRLKILLGDLNTKVGKEDVFKPTIGNVSLREISNDNGIITINATMCTCIIYCT
jgi:exonuclease III